MKNFSKNSLVVSIIFCAICSFAFFFLYKEIKNNNNLVQDAQTKWQEEESKREDIKSLDQSIKTIEPEREELETHFAQGSDVVPFLNSLEALGSSSGCKAKISSVDLSGDNTGLIVQLSATGSFVQIYKFITLLENSPYQLEIDSASIQNSVSGDNLKNNVNNSTWEANFKIKLVSFIS